MKLNRLVFPLMIGLCAALATTGCKTKTPKLTTLPGQRAAQIGDPRPGDTLGLGNPMNPTDGLNSGPGVPLANLDEFEGMIKDPAALAAHTVHFAFDSSVIKSTDQPNMEAVAAALKNNMSDKLLIEGNCDERGTEEYNRSLGERRALAAREGLAKLGVSPERIRTISYGKDKPVDPGHDEAAWAKNRNATFVLLHPKAGI